MAFLPPSLGEGSQQLGLAWPQQAWGQTPPSKQGLPTRRRMLSGGSKWLIVRGSPGRGLEIAIFWVFCVFGGAEGISRAWQKRFVKKRPPSG